MANRAFSDTTAGRGLNPVTGERKISDAESLLQMKSRPKHGLTLERISDGIHLDPPGLYMGRCKCGWESEKPRGQFLIRDEFAAHADNLWEVE